jgi:hypothetical protein
MKANDPLLKLLLDDDVWQKEKNDWKKDIESVKVPKDIEGQIHILESELDKLYVKASYKYNHYKTLYENIEDTIKAVKKANSNKGNNKEEREANAYMHLYYYPSGDPDDIETTNLIEARKQIRKRYYFYRDFVIDNLKTKADRINSDIGASKIDAQLTSNINAS